jgi:hypothetical protein
MRKYCRRWWRPGRARCEHAVLTRSRGGTAFVNGDIAIVGARRLGSTFIHALSNAIAVKWGVGLLLALAAGTALAQGAPWVAKRVHGYRIALKVEAVFEAGRPGTDPRHARVLEHRLRVSIHDAKTGSATPIATVTADVAESGYAGTVIPLGPPGPGTPGLYEGRAWLRTDPPHRILVRASPAGGGRTLEVQFEYRHHH